MINVFLGHGKMLRAFFASMFWTPLSRLCYLVYLLFPILNMIVISSMQQSLFLSYNHITALLVGNYVFQFATALLFFVLFEQPIARLIFTNKSK